MKIQIKNRYSQSVIIEGEADSLKEFLEKNVKANLSRAYLSGADLSGAYLSGAKIKVNQKEDLLKSLKIEIVE